jgi:SAM-dependent methyltransferase
MIDLKNEEVRNTVREHYGLIAREQSQGCGCGDGCCTPASKESAASADCGCSSACCANAGEISQVLGYNIQQINLVPEGANLGLGCGNPQAIASLKAGETVLDLGSGGGFDCFLASRSVGKEGTVIGVDMTADMLALARRNAAAGGYANVEFRMGEIEHLPVADGTVNVIISNCVINLSPDKPQVFREAFRVLKRGGRLAISDMVASASLPDELKNDLTRHSQCIAGATPLHDLEAMMREAGFEAVKIAPKAESRLFVKDWAPGTGIEDFILSATIEAVKP